MAKKTTSKKKARKRKRGNPAGLHNPLILIDTNILLDFYRARNEQGLSLLRRLDDIQDKTVVTYQIEMEFKKNRQSAIIESLKDLKLDKHISLPAYLKDHQSAKSARKSLKDADAYVSKLKTSLHNAMTKPNTHDEVYMHAQRLFRCNTTTNLTRENELKYKIRRTAMRRFILGYPPRKKNDTSIGDAINWEWAINRAIDGKHDLVIVSRDSDYGVSYGKESHINDWLAQEFKQRVSKQGRIRLTQRLSTGFEWLDLAVSKEEKSSEESLIQRSANLDKSDFESRKKIWRMLLTNYIDKEKIEDVDDDEFIIYSDDP